MLIFCGIACTIMTLGTAKLPGVFTYIVFGDHNLETLISYLWFLNE